MDMVLTFYIGRFAIVTILIMASFDKLSSASENSDFIIEFHKHAACYVPDWIKPREEIFF